MPMLTTVLMRSPVTPVHAPSPGVKPSARARSVSQAGVLVASTGESVTGRPRSLGNLLHLLLDGLDELHPRLLELVDALGLEHQEHVVEVDAGLAELVED